MENNNTLNFDAQYIDNNNKYSLMTLFMRSKIIDPCRVSWSSNIGFNILLSNRPNLLLVISIESFEIIN